MNFHSWYRRTGIDLEKLSRSAFSPRFRHVQPAQSSTSGDAGNGQYTAANAAGIQMGPVMLSHSPDRARIDPLVLTMVLIGIVSAVVLATAL
jgi:hypothetical protein